MSAFNFRIPKHRRVTIAEDDGAYQPSVSRKRRKPTNDLRFLDALPGLSHFPAPSSDLLKCVHHFASNYYAERGQLFNDSRIYRKAQKQRRLAKKARLETQAEEEDESEENSPEKVKTTRRRDMYKTMDGSALLAVGMLLQEHIARTLATRIPADWEAEDDHEEPQVGTPLR
ncbi:hypothetical protein C8F01DRAFT_1366201 [Mycena amicta]|nr:hypothetical protein C8F01DRAFT_1366201 [Mycena amicta]